MDKKAYVNGGDVKHIDLPELTLAAQFNKTVSEFGNEKIYFMILTETLRNIHMHP